MEAYRPVIMSDRRNRANYCYGALWYLTLQKLESFGKTSSLITNQAYAKVVSSFISSNRLLYQFDQLDQVIFD